MSALKLGWASRDISTDKPVVIPGQGFARISKGIMDPITSTALVVDDGNDCVIFVSIDAVGVRSGLLSAIRKAVHELDAEIPVEKLFVNPTHAHTGASHDITGTYFQTNEENPLHAPINVEIEPSSVYHQWLVQTMAEMIVEAWKKRSEGGIAYGYGYAVVAHSRRVCYFDDLSKRNGYKGRETYVINGHAAMYGNTNDDNFSHYEAGADHFINLMYTFDADGQLTGAIVNVPCPSQNSESEWYLTADYWHDVRVAIREKHGDIFILPQCAAAGDLSPRILHYKQAQARRFHLKYGTDANSANRSTEIELAARKDIAERIADAFDEVLSWARKDIRTEAKVSHKVSTVELDRFRIGDDDVVAFRKALKENKEQEFVTTDDPVADLITNTRIIHSCNRYLGVIQRYEEQKTQPNYQMELHVLRIGDIAFATNRFELYMDYQHRIQARSPFEQTFIVQLVGQPDGYPVQGYLCTERALEGRGYSAIAYSIRVSPKGGQQLVDETVRQLKELYNEE